MKVEIVCKNLNCPTRIDRAQVQLVECHRIRRSKDRQIPIDQDDFPVGCPWCGKAVTIDRISREAAQFPLGRVEVLNEARVRLSVSDDPLSWAEAAAELVAMHVSGEHGSVTDEVLTRNVEVIALLPFVREIDKIISQFFVEPGYLWVITTPANGITQVLGRAALEKKIG